MNLVDKISKDLLSLNSFVKDTVKKNIVDHVQRGQISLRDDELKNLLFLVESSIDNSVQKAMTNFQRSVNTYLTSYKNEILQNNTRK